MSDTSGHQAETIAQERKPPTLADIVREKTDDGRRIIDFFLDVMEARVEGAELCHRMDAARQLVKYGSKDAARFIARYRGVSCGHSIRGRRDPADSCSNTDATGRDNAPGPFTEDLLTVLSAVDEDLMARLVRAQTVDGGTIIDFLDDVMQDRNEGFKCHHRIAAAKELIVHIVRDEQPESVPGDTSVSVSAQAPSSVRVEPVLSTVEEPVLSLPKEPALSTVERLVEGSEPVLSTVEGPQLETNNSKLETLPVRRTRTRRTRTQRRRDGAAGAANLRRAPGSERHKGKKQDKPAPVELTPAERRIKERLENLWHEPDPWGAPIDSASPGRSPPW